MIRRPWLAAAAVAFAAPVVVAEVASSTATITAQVDLDVEHVDVRSGEGPWQVAARLCPANPDPVFADLSAANPWWRSVTLQPGTVLHWHPASCQEQPSTTTTSSPSSTAPSTTTTVEPSTTSSVVASTSTTTTSSVAPTTTATTAPPTTSTVPAGTFLATFDTEADFFDAFDWHWGMLPDPRGGPQDGQTALGDHSEHGGIDGNCGAAQSTTRVVGLADPESNIYWCDPDGPAGPASGHVMTATPYTGYGILSFTPNRSFRDVTQVCWDQNLTDVGGRRWVNVLILPEAAYQAAPPAQPDTGTSPQRLDYAAPGFGPGHDVGSDNLDAPASSATIKVFAGLMFWHSQSQDLEDGVIGQLTYGNTDKATRYRHCITDNGEGTVTLDQDSPSGHHTDTFPGDLPDGEVRVIFQDDRYDTDIADHPITWHYDSVLVETG